MAVLYVKLWYYFKTLYFWQNHFLSLFWIFFYIPYELSFYMRHYKITTKTSIKIYFRQILHRQNIHTSNSPSYVKLHIISKILGFQATFKYKLYRYPFYLPIYQLNTSCPCTKCMLILKTMSPGPIRYDSYNWLSNLQILRWPP